MPSSGLKLRKRINYLTYLALLITFAVVIHTVEAALPLPMPVPGVRLGLANIITILTLALFGLRSALLVTILRTILGSLIIGNIFGFGFWLSITAGITSSLSMALILILKEKGFVSLLSVSITGAAVHNLTQLTMASVIIASPDLIRGYYPLLILLSIPTGIFTGVAASYLEGVTARMIERAKIGVTK